MDNYQIISVSFGFSPKKALAELTRQVNEAMRQGWSPLGGVAVTGTLILQTMGKNR